MEQITEQLREIAGELRGNSGMITKTLLSRKLFEMSAEFESISCGINIVLQGIQDNDPYSTILFGLKQHLDRVIDDLDDLTSQVELEGITDEQKTD